MNEPSSHPMQDTADEIRRDLEQIETRFLAALARGEKPALEEFVAANPHVADQLRQRLEEDLALYSLNRDAAVAWHPESSDPRLPERIDRYIVEGKLGEGAASVVLRGFDPVLDRPVAIKLLRQALPAGSDFSERFAREARVIARLRHAHIVPVFDCGEFAGWPYLVMELVAGRTLDEELSRQGGGMRSGEFGVRSAGNSALSGESEHPTAARGFPPVDFRRTADLIRKIAEALHYAHERGIIHRDVKPGNILLDEHDEPQLADFGLAMRDAGESERSARRSTDCQSVRHETAEAGETPLIKCRQSVETDMRANSPHYDGNGDVPRSVGCPSVRNATHAEEGGSANVSGKSVEADMRADSPHYGIDGGCEPSLTHTHQLLGTPAYMSPEQAAGRAGDADRRSDLFSLGIVLYRLLTGERPFVGNDAELRDRIQFASPIRPRAINTSIPRDLETICLKAMEKLPADRYQTAQLMADELRRWREDQPLVITPPSFLRRAGGWVMRNRGITAMGGLAVVLAVVAIAGRINAQLRQREVFIAAGGRAETDLWNLIADGRERLRGNDQGRTARVQSEILSRIAQHREQLLPDAPREEIDCEVRSLFAATLAEFDLKLVHTAELPISLNLLWPVALHPSGAFAAVGSADRPVRIELNVDRPAITGIENREPRSRVTFSPDGRWLAFSPGSAGVELWDGAVQQCVARCLPSDARRLVSMAFDPYGERLLVCDNHGRLSRLAVPSLREESNVIPRLKGLNAEVTCAAFRHDLSQVVLGDALGQIIVVDLIDGMQQEYPAIPLAVASLAWSPDRTMLAVGGRDGVVQVFDTLSHARIYRLATGSNAVQGLCFTPDGAKLAAGCHGSSGCIWSLESGQIELKLPAIPCGLTADGARLLATSQQRLETYDLISSGPIRRLPGHQASVDQLVWSAKGWSFVTIDNRFVVRVWDAHGTQAPSQFTLPAPEWYPSDVGLAVSDDGATVVTAHRTGGQSELRILDRSGQCRQSWKLPAGYDRLALREDGAIVSVRQEECEFNRGPCRTVFREFTPGHDPIVRGVLRQSDPEEHGFFSHDLSREGRHYIFTGPRLPRANAQTEVWDLNDSEQLLRLSQEGKADWGDPNARMGGPGLTLWSVNRQSPSRYDLRSGPRMPAVAVFRMPVAVSRDGRWSLFGDAYRQSRAVLTIANGYPPQERAWVRLSSRDNTVSGMMGGALSPDSRYLAWGSQSGEITLVDLPLLKEKVEEFERIYARE